jgi:nucleotide-binding universal stress UspA family protein
MSNVRNIMVHLNRGARSAVRLKFAVDLARQHQARLVGVFAQNAPPHRVGLVATWPSEDYVRNAEACKAEFDAVTKGMADAHWYDINRGSDMEINRHMSDVARHFDLVVLGQHEQAEQLVPRDLAEHVILQSGRPVLVLPAFGTYHAGFKRPLFAWNDSPAAARALNDSLPLLAQDADSVVLSITEHTEAATHSGEMILAHLTSHKVKARSDMLVVKDIGVMDSLLNRASDNGSDLLVLGAFGGYARMFGHRGAGSRYILEHMTLPVLFSH